MGMPQPNIGQTPAMGALPARSFMPEMGASPARSFMPAETRQTGGFKPQPQQPNIFQQSAGAYTDALAGTRAGMNAPIGMVGARNVRGQGYNPTTGKAAQMRGVDPIQAQTVSSGPTQAFGYSASTIAGVDPITAQQIQAQTIYDNMGKYANPFEQQVVDSTMRDLDRQRQMQINTVGTEATRAGAFGGSRQGIAEAETNRLAMQQMADATGRLRSQGFTQAAQLGAQDVQTAQQAAMANQSADLQAQTTTAQQALQTQMANQQAVNQARAQLAQAQNSAQQADAQRSLQSALANQQADLQAQTTTGQQALTSQQANMGAQNQMTLANMGAMNQAGQFGASAMNAANLANQQAQLQAQLANQQAQQATANRLMSGGAQLGNLSNLGFGMGRQLNQDQMMAGNQQQQLMQQLINAGRGQFQDYTQSPTDALNTLIGAYTGSQTGQQTQENTRNPGLFDILSLGLV